MPVSQMRVCGGSGSEMWSSCSLHLPPPEMLGSRPLKSVPLLEACLLSLRQGRTGSSQMMGRRLRLGRDRPGTCVRCRPISVTARAGQVLPSGLCWAGAQLVQSTALQEVTRPSRRAESRATPCHLPVTQRVLDGSKRSC